MAVSSTDLNAQLGRRLRGPSMVIWLSGAAVWLFIVWAAYAWIDEIVRADGEFISTSRPQIIQNLEGGILAELLVKEGDEVMRGDVLARLYGTQFRSSVDDLEDQITALD
ncbi:MAG: biotin/lipoyl-binding protein, partial [Marivita sp.]